MSEKAGGETPFARVVAKEIRAWNTDNASERLELLRQACEEDAVFLSPYGVVQGVAELSDEIGKFRHRYPQARVTHGHGNEHHGFGHFSWTTFFGGTREPLEGVDFIELDRSGKVRRLVSFSPAEGDPGRVTSSHSSTP